MRVYQLDSKKKNRFSNSLSVTSQLIILNVFLFFVFILLISLNVLTWDYIALNPANILQGAYLWTFLTSMFMHGGIFHLFVNMLSLYFVGNLIEKLLGKKRYLSFYLIAGIFASILFVISPFIIPGDFNTYAVGASGALFALIGLLMILTPNLPVYMMFIPIPIKMKYAAPFMLVVLWIISVTANVPIGNVAHLGGLIFGLIYGIYLKKKFPRKTDHISRRFS